MMSAAHIQPGNLRQKFSKLLLYRLQCFLQVIRILFAERMKMQSVDPFQTFPVKVLSGNPQPGTRRTGIIDRMIPLSGAFRINTESQTGSGTTGVPAMIGSMMVVTGQWKKPGVFNVEEFDPDPYMEALNKWGLPWKVCEDPELVKVWKANED